ncbi:ribokinase [Trifolium repens]|nr:ribokinase [Trifolium repens]
MDRGNNCSKSTCFYASKLATNLRADGIGTTCAKLYIGTAENMPPYELIDTTGAGDAFARAVLYAICANFATEKMLCFAANVEAAKCRALGARSGLPRYKNNTFGYLSFEDMLQNSEDAIAATTMMAMQFVLII